LRDVGGFLVLGHFRGDASRRGARVVAEPMDKRSFRVRVFSQPGRIERIDALESEAPDRVANFRRQRDMPVFDQVPGADLFPLVEESLPESARVSDVVLYGPHHALRRDEDVRSGQ
jgi:hypothetical protein